MTWLDAAIAAGGVLGGVLGTLGVSKYLVGKAPAGRDAWDADRKATEPKPAPPKDP